MKQTGTIISTDGTMAKIAIVRGSACGENCASCSASCNSKTVVEAQNTLGAKIGDRVELEMESSQVLFTAFLVYSLPLIALIVFYFIGALFSEAIGAAVGFLSMALSFAGVIAFSKKNKNKYALKVEKILE